MAKTGIAASTHPRNDDKIHLTAIFDSFFRIKNCNKPVTVAPIATQTGSLYDHVSERLRSNNTKVPPIPASEKNNQFMLIRLNFFSNIHCANPTPVPIPSPTYNCRSFAPSLSSGADKTIISITPSSQPIEVQAIHFIFD